MGDNNGEHGGSSKRVLMSKTLWFSVWCTVIVVLSLYFLGQSGDMQFLGGEQVEMGIGSMKIFLGLSLACSLLGIMGSGWFAYQKFCKGQNFIRQKYAPVVPKPEPVPVTSPISASAGSASSESNSQTLPKLPLSSNNSAT